MLLDDTAGCPGKWLPFRRSHVGICIQCDRYRRGGEQIEPAARVDTYGSFFCDERRYTGTHSPDRSVTGELSGVGALGHGANCAPSEPAAPCLTVGAPKGGAHKSEAREQQQLRAGFCHHEEGASR